MMVPSEKVNHGALWAHLQRVWFGPRAVAVRESRLLVAPAARPHPDPSAASVSRCDARRALPLSPAASFAARRF